MEPIIIYAVCIVVALSLLTVLRVVKIIRTFIQRFYVFMIKKRLCYPLLFKRPNGTTDVSRLDGLVLIVYTASSAIFMSLQSHNWADVSRKASYLAVVNLALLFFGGRTSLIVDRVLSISRARYELMHRWIGRICVVQGVLHGILNLFSNQSRTMGLPVG